MAMLLCAFSANAQSDGVAKIGSTTYATFAEALTAASAMSGDVTIEVHDKVTLNTAFSGSYSSINFVGKDTDAEIYLDVQGYITATGKKVSFTDLTLSKSAGGFITNAGFMNVAFGIYDVVEVAYTNCVFANGAYASSGNVTFNGCTFYRSYDKYGLWAYGDVNATVEDCTFADYRGIKMYAEGAAKTVDLTVKKTDFSAVTDKPAIVLTYGESVVLEGNTYSSTGTFELDLDGAPNGTAVTSDVAPTCENDNGTCGVLVDGKIYTTVAQAAEVAAEGSNVTLLYSTTDAVEFAEGVNLTLADGVTAKNVTVEVSLAGEGTEASPYLISSVADLETLRNKVNAGNSYAGQFVKLAADLTLTEAWTPIGNGTRSSKSYSGNAFKGTFDGDNKTISGLKITSTTGNDAAIGLFGVVDGGTVKNLTLDNVDINVTNSNLAGGAIGLMLGGATAENITVNGAIVGYDGVGGIVGRLVINGTIKDCTNNASVTSSYGGIGGIVGKAYYEDSANTTIFASIDNCTNNGTVTAPMYVGGIVGLARANVTGCVNNGPVVGGTQTGGIIGQLIAAGTVSGNENKAKITGKNHLGGIIGDYSQSSAYTYNNVAITSNINRGELAATEQCAAIMGCNNIDGFTAMTATGNLSYYFVEGLELFGNPEDMVIDATNKFMLPVAKIGDVEYDTLAEAVAAAQAGDEIVLLGDVAEDATLPAGVKFNGNGKTVGNLTAGGEITFTGVTKAVSFSVQNTNTTVNIVAGACLEITGTNRMVIGHGCTFNITGNIENAKTADVAALTPSLIIPGASFTGAGVTFNVTNAYISAPSSYSSSSKSANGTFDFNFTNSIWESAGKLAFESQSTAATVNFDLVNSVLNTGSHLVFGVSRGEVVIDNSNVNVGTTRQIENQSTMTIKNGSVVNGAVATSSNAKNPGTLIVENATYAVTGEFSGSDLGTGTLIVKKGATVSAGSITKANIQIDATGMAAGDEVNLTANLSNLEGSLTVVNNNLDASIVDGKIVLAVKPVAKIGDVEYATLDEAFGAATEGATITLLADATPALTSQSAITKAAVIDLGGNTLTLTEDDLYFGTTTFKNGTIVVDPSVSASTAVFWMFANQTLTFDAVKVVATGVTGTYLIGLDGNNSDLNLLNGSEILIENTTALDLDVICVNASTGNDIVVENSKVNVTNLDGRVFFRGNYTVKDSEVSLAGITKAGFRIEAGQTLSIEGTSTVTIEGEPRDGGIHITDATATYTKAETATVNATVYAPATGSNSLAYTKEENGYVRVWGEGGGNAKESYELKLYSGETLIATTKLNNVGNIIDGDVYVTWNFYYPQSTDEYWTTTWEEGHPNSAAQPTEVELYIDGTLVATTAAKMSGADDVAPVVWRNLGGVAIANLLGEGTAENPYLIETLKDLKFFRDDVNTYTQDGSNQYKGKYVKLTADIDLAGENWEPIGKNSNGDHQNFLGTFYGEKADGTKPTISNLYINADGDHLGFFARVGSYAEGLTPTVKNIKFNNVDVSSNTTNSHSGSYVAGVIANAGGNSVVSGIEVTGDVYVVGYGYIGGIVGHGYPDIDNCHVAANDGSYIHSHYWCVGGIIGYAGEGGTPITNSSVSGVDIWSAYGAAAAIAGLLNDGNKLENVSASNVDITSNSDYCMGYIAGNGNASTMTGISIENVTATAKGNPITPTDAIAKVNDAIYFSLQEALNAAAAGTGNVTVEILRDVDLTDVDWNPVTVSAPGYPVVTVEGNNKTITGLNDMLFAGTWAGGSGLIIKNLTIDESAIVNDKDDANGTVGVGAFIGFPQASATITLENCHLKNSSVEGGHWTGGLIGYAAGYAGEDGPVFMNLTVKNCSVTGSTITGKGSVGGIIGHGSGNGWTNVVIEETTVKDNTITSTGSSNVKAGAIMGTIGAAGQPTTANGVTKTGGASVSATVAGNTVTSNGTTITTIYGRQGTATGQLYVAGGSYDNYPIEQGVAYAAPIEGYEIVQNTDGTYGLDEKVELPEVEITDIKGLLTDSDPDLTFALNFTIKDLENLDEEYLNKVMEQYGSWYTDYVLTISGLTDENVTFNANGNGDGYLAGQYDGFGPNWVSVPFENVTLANNESIYIMEYAAKLMGQSGLRYTLAEIVSIVMDFDCGVYFTPEFLTANPGLKVDLHLKVFTEDAEGNKVNDINVATNNFDVEDYVAIVHADGKQTAYCTTLAEAVAAAEADETITLIADVELTETLNIPAGKTIALDLNGKTISQTKEQTAGYQMILNDGNLTINDSSEAKTGKISYTDSGNGGEYISDVIYNRSVLVINGGTIENLSSATVASNGYPHAVDTYSGIRDTYVEINGGTIYCAEYSAIRMFCVSATNKADLVINGGTIKGAIDMQNGTKNLALGTLTINDGTFETTKNANNIRFANWNGGATEYGISAEIKGGSFNGGITTAYVPAAANWDKGVITGGTFAKDMTEYCAEGFMCQANGDGTYGIVADPNYIAELVIDDAKGENYTNDTEKTVGTLTYVRTLPAAGIWYPVFLPFDVPVAALDAELFDVARINDFHTNFSEEDGSIEKMWVEYIVRKSGTLAAGKPFLVRAKNSNVLEMVIELEDVTLYPADKKSTITVGSVITEVTFEGVYESLDAPVSTPSTRYLAVNAAGVWDEFDGYSLNPFRVMMTLQILDEEYYISSAASLSVGARVIGEENEDGTTTIYDVEVDRENCEDMIFDLQGRRVLEPEKGGIYIKNGKKIIF